MEDGTPTKSDGRLLRLYREHGDEAAFAELRRRYERLVFSTCQRETGNPSLAEDATQGVFLLLIRKSFPEDASLAGWLFTAARLVSKNLVRQEERRRRREQKAGGVVKEDGGWSEVEPLINGALAELKTVDREALLLRFAGEMSLAQVGQSLGITENTARMRVSRALERVRANLRRSGVGVGVAALASLLSTRLAEATPIGGGQISAQALQATGAAGRTLTFASVWKPFVLGLAVLGTGGATLHTLSAGPPRLSRAEAGQLLASAAGGWAGTLEYADDRTGIRTKTETTVVVDRTGGGLRIEARYPTFANVDTTTIVPTGLGKYRIETGGPGSSHRLDGDYDLVRMPDGRPAFLGFSFAVRADVRLFLVPQDGALTLQEEVRRGEEYRFRNRFDLKRKSPP